MMLKLTQVVERCHVEHGELESWIALSWVLPVESEEGWLFSDTDIARIELICDLRHDLAMDEEAIGVILPLLDQVHSLRRSLKAVTEAVLDLPEPARTQVLDRLEKSGLR
jgi:chaperone modulatory protein CbpM